LSTNGEYMVQVVFINVVWRKVIVSGAPTTVTITIPTSCTLVGGIYIPVNKLELLAPYIRLTILLAVAVMTVGYLKKRKAPPTK